jgi:nucleotide-binding universal stress UspA family protein
MFQRILVPLDGSQRAEQAVPVATRVARATGGSLVLLHVLSAPAELVPFVASALEPSTLVADESAGMSYLEVVAGLFPDLSTEVAVRTGLAASTIATFADNSQADAIFLTSHGRSNLVHRLLGDVAERVVHSSRVPVLMLREPLPLRAGDAIDATAPTDATASQAGGPQPAAQPAPSVSSLSSAPPASSSEPLIPLRVLLPLDGSPEAELALQPAAVLAAALSAPGQAKLDLVRVIPDGASAQERGAAEQYLQDAIARLQADGATPAVATDWAVAEGHDAAEMVTIIGTEDEGTPRGYHIVALATPPASRVNHWPFGDVIDRLLYSTKLSLLLVHPPRTS